MVSLCLAHHLFLFLLQPTLLLLLLPTLLLTLHQIVD